MIMTNLTNALTEKGNLKTGVQKAIKAQASAYLEKLGFAKQPNGKYAKIVATADGKTITVNLDMSVGLDTNFDAKPKVSQGKATQAEPVQVEELF